MISIYTSLLDHIYANSGKSKIHVVLHSSCVLDKELDRLFSDKLISSFYTFHMFEDSRYEALLLRESKIGSIAHNARLLTADTAVFGNINLRDCYGKDKNYRIIDRFRPSASNQTIFVFCEPSAAEEFVTNVVPGAREKAAAVNYNIDFSGYEHLSILCFNYFGGALDIRNSYTAPIKLKYFSAGNFELWHMRETPKIINTLYANSFSTKDSQRFLIDCDNKIAAVSRSGLKSIYQGGFAEIFEITGVSELEGKLLKILKNPPADKNFERYLARLSEFKSIFADRIAFPEAAVYDEKNRFCGFMMSKAECRPLNSLNDYVGLKDFDEELIDRHLLECSRYASDLALLLLEMRVFGLSMTDLSGRNICLKRDNSIFMVDADSIELQGFVFKEWFCTPGYSCENISRCGEREYYFPVNFTEFSLAVLLFRLYFRSNPLVNNGADFETDYEDWRQAMQSIFRINKITSESAYLAQLPEKVWCDSFSREQKRAFIKAFNDDKIYTVGQWIKILNLISE